MGVIFPNIVVAEDCIVGKKENGYFIPFIRYYLAVNFPNINSIMPKSFPDGCNKKSPDYEISEIDTIVEIKEIHNKIKKYHKEAWGKDIERIRPKIIQRLKAKNITGIYDYKIPNPFHIPKKDVSNENAFVDKVVSDVCDNIRLKNYESDEAQVRFFSSNNCPLSFPGIDNIIDEIYKALEYNIKNADEQLGNVDKKYKRVLLLIQFIEYIPYIPRIPFTSKEAYMKALKKIDVITPAIKYVKSYAA